MSDNFTIFSKLVIIALLTHAQAKFPLPSLLPNDVIDRHCLAFILKVMCQVILSDLAPHVLVPCPRSLVWEQM